MISVAEATRLIRSAVPLGGAETVPTLEAGGRILREGVRAERAFPPYDRIMMDGIGVSREAWDAGQREFDVVGSAMAGTPRQALKDEKEAFGVATGAIAPLGVGLVIPSERLQTAGKNRYVAEEFTPPPGGFIHRMGSDAPSGAELLTSGARLDSRAMAVAVSCGAVEVVVSVKPRIAVVSTGDELVELGQPIEPHQIRRSNPYALERALAGHGYPGAFLHHFEDTPESLRDGLERLITEHDFVLLSGGVSKGERDLVPDILKELGAETIFHGVSQRPGKPMLFAKREKTLVFGLPGNPVSTLVGLYRHVLPAIDIWCGAAERKPLTVTLSEPIMFPPPLTWFLPVACDGIGSVAPRPIANSGDFAALIGTDGFVELPAKTSDFAAGFAAPFFRW